MTGHGLRWGVMGKAIRAGMTADQDQVRGCLTVFAADEALWVVAVLVVHLEGAGHVRPPWDRGRPRRQGFTGCNRVRFPARRP